MARSERSLKVVVLGEAGVGKTSLVERFVNDFYTDCHETTINVDVYRKKITVDDQNITLEIWDTAGCERFHSLSVGFYRGAVCCVLMFDITNPNTFSKLEIWRDNFLLVTTARQPALYPFVVIGNKTDLPDRTVATKRAEQWCASNGNLPYFETSVRKAINVDIAFQAVARRALNQSIESVPPSITHKSFRLRKNNRLDTVPGENSDGSGEWRTAESGTKCGAMRAWCGR